jgi:hypothetical protein
MEPKRIYLKNDNNRLQCEAFLQIHFAPESRLTEKDLSNTFVVDVGGVDTFLQMVDFMRVPFDQVSSLMTLPSTGMESDVWKQKWLEDFPNTQPGTMMAVYMYKKLKDNF